MTVVLTLIVVSSVATVASRHVGAQSFNQREEGRVWGADRISTAIAISNRGFPQGASTAYLADAEGFADALAAGSLVDGPVLLVPRCGELPGIVVAEIDRLDPQQVLALGGVAGVSDQILRQAVQGRPEPELTCPGALAAHQGDVELFVRERGDRAVLSIANRSGSTLEFGEYYVLERLEGGGFEPLVPAVGPFPDVARQLADGEVSEVATIGPTIVQAGEERPLPPGRYRAIKDVSGHRLAVEFTIQ